MGSIDLALVEVHLLPVFRQESWLQQFVCDVLVHATIDVELNSVVNELLQQDSILKALPQLKNKCPILNGIFLMLGGTFVVLCQLCIVVILVLYVVFIIHLKGLIARRSSASRSMHHPWKAFWPSSLWREICCIFFFHLKDRGNKGLRINTKTQKPMWRKVPDQEVFPTAHPCLQGWGSAQERCPWQSYLAMVANNSNARFPGYCMLLPIINLFWVFWKQVSQDTHAHFKAVHPQFFG